MEIHEAGTEVLENKGFLCVFLLPGNCGDADQCSADYPPAGDGPSMWKRNTQTRTNPYEIRARLFLVQYEIFMPGVHQVRILNQTKSYHRRNFYTDQKQPNERLKWNTPILQSLNQRKALFLQRFWRNSDLPWLKGSVRRAAKP